MALYRKIENTIWESNWYSNLSQFDKLLWMYLRTNVNVKAVGNQEVNLRVTAFHLSDNDTTVSANTIKETLKRFESEGKVTYDEETNELLINDFFVDNWSNSPKNKKAYLEAIFLIKSQKVIQYIYSIKPELNSSNTTSPRVDNELIRLDNENESDGEKNTSLTHALIAKLKKQKLFISEAAKLGLNGKLDHHLEIWANKKVTFNDEYKKPINQLVPDFVTYVHSLKKSKPITDQPKYSKIN